MDETLPQSPPPVDGLPAERLTLTARAIGPGAAAAGRALAGSAHPPEVVFNSDESLLTARFHAKDSEELTSVKAIWRETLFHSGLDFAVFSGAERKRLLIADMDSTIIGCECLDELADFAGKKAEVSAITERAMAGELDFEEALTARVAMLKGLPLSALQACFDERVRLNGGAETLVKTMAAHGARCVLVSGGFTFFTSRVAALAGFHAHRANTLLDDGERLTGEVARPILGRESKLQALLEECEALGIGAQDAIAIGDGANDLAMIEAAGLGVAYRAKPIVAARANARLQRFDLTGALWFQGYDRSDCV